MPALRGLRPACDGSVRAAGRIQLLFLQSAGGFAIGPLLRVLRLWLGSLRPRTERCAAAAADRHGAGAMLNNGPADAQALIGLTTVAARSLAAPRCGRRSLSAMVEACRGADAAVQSGGSHSP